MAEKIIQEKQNPLLKRKEIRMIIESEKNPSMQEASKILSEKFKALEENIAVNLIKGKFGRKTFLVSANIYETKKDKEYIEPKPKRKKVQEQKQEEKKEKEQKLAEKSEKKEEKATAEKLKEELKETAKQNLNKT